MKEPFATVYMILAHRNHPLGSWKAGIKNTGDAIYIGSDACHVTLLSSETGFHLTEFSKKYSHEKLGLTAYQIESYLSPNLREPMEEGEIAEANMMCSSSRAKIITILNDLSWSAQSVGRSF